MVNSERNKPYFTDLHGFEEAEEIASKLSKNASILPLDNKVIKIEKNKINENNSLIRSEEKSLIDQNIVIIEKFYTELTPPNSRTKDEIIAFNDNINNNQKSKKFPTCDEMNEFEIEFEKEKEKEIRRILVQKCHSKRNIFLVAMEDYFKTVNTAKLSRVKTSTKITTNEIIDEITKLKTTVTTTEKIVTEMITVPTYVKISDYVDNVLIDFSSFPATKVR
jgi:hypothetical protein